MRNLTRHKTSSKTEGPIEPDAIYTPTSRKVTEICTAVSDFGLSNEDSEIISDVYSILQPEQMREYEGLIIRDWDSEDAMWHWKYSLFDMFGGVY